MTLSVRPARPSDASIIVDYNRRLAEESEGKQLDPTILRVGVEAGLADENKALYFVAEKDGAVVGQLMLTREWSDWRNGWIYWIQSVYVEVSARRGGVFTALFEHVRRLAEADPAVVGLRLYVERDNATARRTYERVGMSPTGYWVYERCPV